MSNPSIEMICTVDDKNEVIGSIDIIEYYLLPEKERPYIRSVGAFVLNDAGMLWVPRRAIHKKVLPGGLDYSVGGHVRAGESYRDAIVREAYEEIHWGLNAKQLEEVATFPATRFMPYFRTLYIYRSNEVPEVNPEDHSEILQISLQDLKARLESGESSKKSLHEAVSFLIDGGFQ
jgi:isopentenyldiphosphate isomerase